MANTSARMLRLLLLLQTHRYWPETELADRLEVSPRSVALSHTRRDGASGPAGRAPPARCAGAAVVPRRLGRRAARLAELPRGPDDGSGPTGVRFRQRKLPGGDAAAFVQSGFAAIPTRYQVLATIHALRRGSSAPWPWSSRSPNRRSSSSTSANWAPVHPCRQQLSGVRLICDIKFAGNDDVRESAE